MKPATVQQPQVLGQLFAKLSERHPELLAQLFQQLNDDESKPSPYPPLHLETRDAVDTATAAYHLNRRPQTLRGWSCLENGPLRPIRVNGYLAWPVSDIKRLLLGVPA